MWTTRYFVEIWGDKDDDIVISCASLEEAERIRKHCNRDAVVTFEEGWIDV